jgi:hypothetical protein
MDKATVGFVTAPKERVDTDGRDHTSSKMGESAPAPTTDVAAVTLKFTEVKLPAPCGIIVTNACL